MSHHDDDTTVGENGHGHSDETETSRRLLRLERAVHGERETDGLKAAHVRTLGMFGTVRDDLKAIVATLHTQSADINAVSKLLAISFCALSIFHLIVFVMVYKLGVQVGGW